MNLTDEQAENWRRALGLDGVNDKMIQVLRDRLQQRVLNEYPDIIFRLRDKGTNELHSETRRILLSRR